MHIQAVLFLLHFALFANAGVYFIQPATGSSCAAGRGCVLSWLDDGDAPFITDIGVVSAGLYHGKQQLVQAIPPLNVANLHSIEFNPNAQAGPNSDSYYIAFISTNDKVNGTQYAAFSPFFTLTGMSGSFSAPLASATDTFSVPTSLFSTGSLSDVTITVGNVDTSLPPISTPTPSAPPSSAASSKSQIPSSSTPASTPTSSSASTISSTSSRFTVSTLPPSSPSESASPSADNSPGPSTSGALPSQPLSLPILAVLSLCAVMFS
ncbi:hypothetical protein C8F04DRAFT_988309 [Mycena alexandri]|uniref:Yeast cell wall synthesis Kre9/Knh1-like N-terminal domain-containing protein n=1 Tax=Mycena alexandri TaxID=1745969 RepID=A0AAD6THJ6_9AGAR|nr:hypothetical protein C8F04DRAFT_988309 [Mycena alexandri]